MSELDRFEQAAGEWCTECFGDTYTFDLKERQHRFLEEALELVQSLGTDADAAHKMVDYVFNRPKGDPHQEIGGVMVTLAVLTYAHNLSMRQGAYDELTRIMEPEVMARIQEKQRSKPDIETPGADDTRIIDNLSNRGDTLSLDAVESLTDLSLWAIQLYGELPPEKKHKYQDRHHRTMADL